MDTRDLDSKDARYLKVKYTFAKFLKKKGVKNWDELNIKTAEEFAAFYILNKSKKLKLNKNSLKGYVVQNFIYLIIRVIEAESKLFLPKIFCSRLKRFIKNFARPILEETPQLKNRAKVFKLKDIENVITNLFNKNSEICDVAAIALSITFTTGARLADVTNIYVKDIKLITNNLGKFIKISLRNSKNNLLGTNPEQLTFKIDKNNFINLEIHLTKYLSRRIGSPEKLIALKGSRESKIKKITYQFKKISFELGLKNVLSAHSGRNTVLLELCTSLIDDESKKIFMRWKPNSNMPSHYRGLLLECSAIGAAEQLHRKNFNSKSN
jgi:uncharacterized protein YbcI